MPYYSSCSSLSVGCYLYNNTCLTSPVAPGYYSDGTNCFTVGLSGYINSVSVCSSTYYANADFYVCINQICTFNGTSIIAGYTDFAPWVGYYYQGTDLSIAYQVTSTTTDPGYAVPFMFSGPFSSCPLNCFNEI